MTRIAASAVLVLLAVAWLVGSAVWNRSAVVSRITLTERELPWRFTEDGQPVRLSIDWVRRDEAQEARNWLTSDRLLQLGFDLSLPATSPEAARAYSRALPRRAWVVFEYEGDAWRAVELRRSMRAAEGLDEWHGPSRLVPVDVGLDVQALAERYPQGGHLITPAWIQLSWVGPGAGGPLVYGSIRTLDPPSLTVPRALSSRLRALSPSPRDPIERRPGGAAAAPATPRYEVDLAVGRLGIPWVVDVR